MLFTLDISTLGNVNNVSYVETPLQERGRTIQLEWVQSGLGKDIRLHGYAVRGVAGEVVGLDVPVVAVASTAALAYGSGTYGAGAYGIGGP